MGRSHDPRYQPVALICACKPASFTRYAYLSTISFTIIFYSLYMVETVRYTNERTLQQFNI